MDLSAREVEQHALRLRRLGGDQAVPPHLRRVVVVDEQDASIVVGRAHGHAVADLGDAFWQAVGHDVGGVEERALAQQRP